MKKPLILFAILLLYLSVSPALAADGLNEYPYIYKDLRSLGMGGALTAVYGEMESVFYNPAGIRRFGLEINVVNPLIEADENIELLYDVYDALEEGNSTERVNTVRDLLREHPDEVVHARGALFPAFGIRNVFVGYLAQSRFDARLSGTGLSEKISVEGGTERGIIAGGSFSLPGTGITLGASVKYIERVWIDHSFSVPEIALPGFDIEDYEAEGSAASLDAGLIYEIPIPVLRPRVGVSVLDARGLDFGESEVPMRANVGIAINPRLPVVAEFTFAVDYHDVTHRFWEDDSHMKRLHIGAEAAFLHRHLIVRAGLNQGYPCFGVEANLKLFKAGYAFYAEETGREAGDSRDRRHVIKISIGWH